MEAERATVHGGLSRAASWHHAVATGVGQAAWREQVGKKALGAGRTSVCIPRPSRSVTVPQLFELSSSWLSARMMALLSRRPVFACGVGGGARPASWAPVLGSPPVVARGGTRAMNSQGLGGVQSRGPLYVAMQGRG